MQKTNIEWCDFSANPLKYRRKSDGKVVWGCVKTSPGCANCYAEAIALRFDRGKLFNAKNMDELEPFLDESELRKMLTAKTIQGIPVYGSMCFTGDMTDMFGDWVPDELLDRLFAVFALRRDVTWQVLTKRAERMQTYLVDWNRHTPIIDVMNSIANVRAAALKWPLPNVWCGVSVENQQYADERIPHLLRTPAAVRFLSVEPQLGPVDLSAWTKIVEDPSKFWVICGGESGSGARAFNVELARYLRDQCKAAGVQFFFKQAGSLAYDSSGEQICSFDSEQTWINKARSWLGGISGGGFKHKKPKKQVCIDAKGRHCQIGKHFMRATEDNAYPVISLPVLEIGDKKGGDLSEIPEDLRIREFPNVAI